MFTAAGFTAAPPQGNANKHLDFGACEKGCQTLPDREVYLRLVSTMWFLYQAGTGFDQKPVTRFKVYVASSMMPCACLIVFVWNGFLGNVFVWDSRTVISECYVDLCSFHLLQRLISCWREQWFKHRGLFRFLRIPGFTEIGTTTETD